MKNFVSRLMAAFAVLLTVCAFTAAPRNAYADFAERPVGFVVIDKSGGGVDGSVYASWRQVVKWAYHFPDYQITDSSLPQETVGAALRGDVKVDKEVLAALAQKSRVDVLVVAKIYDMDDSIVQPAFSWHDDSTYVRVIADADLYVYKADGDKFLKSRVREHDLKDLGNYEKPQETIRWALSKLVNTMEGRPIIGADN